MRYERTQTGKVAAECAATDCDRPAIHACAPTFIYYLVRCGVLCLAFFGGGRRESERGGRGAGAGEALRSSFNLHFALL